VHAHVAFQDLTPHNARVDRTLEVMVEAARAGGAVALGHFRRGGQARTKPDGSPVTLADSEAEETIARILRAAFPEHGFLGEEAGQSGPAARRFIVDPVDGTRNFVRGIPFWATLVALEEDSQVKAGVVYQPVTGTLHVARRGQGAFRDGRPIRVSSIAAVEEATLLHATLGFLRREGCWEGFLRLVDTTAQQRGFGDFLCFTMVAEGQGDIAIAPGVKPWDLAALLILVEEAGGRLTDMTGAPTIYSGTALATNGLLHQAALDLMRGSRGAGLP
jgi:histidinol-phosphatase